MQKKPGKIIQQLEAGFGHFHPGILGVPCRPFLCRAEEG